MPYSRAAKYRHNRQRPPEQFEKETFKTVPIENTEYSGKKFAKKGNKAVVGRLKKKNRTKRAWAIQSILEKKK